MNECLAKMQLAQYQRAAYRRLLAQKITTPPTWTPRLRRLRAMVVFICCFGLGLPALFLAQTVAVANHLLLPWENARNRRYLRRAQKKLRARPDLICIGITGSYGKTSVKNYLTQFLRVKYRVVASPESYNTPLGLARTINESVDATTQVLILEMGARHPGDIAELCRLFPPQHGIITSIGPCHLATFGNLATVAATKAELLAALPATGWALAPGDNEYCTTLTHPRLQFILPPEPPYQTALLGAHQQMNLALAVTMAGHLGVDEKTCREIIAQLPPVPHRLQKIVTPHGLTILDDSYNANPQSAASALAVLATLPGKKVVQTPGLVEQGDQQAAAHQTLAAQIAAVADAVIIVGRVNAAYFRAYLPRNGLPVYYVPTREAAKKLYPELLTRGDNLLILNDLPEQYG